MGRKRSSEGSLDLLLDTITNTFGGVLFLAILVSLMLRHVGKASSQAAAKRDQVKSGGRAEKIRTYNFKESRVTDHRIGLTIYKLDRVLAGELDEVVEPLMQAERQAQLEAAADG